MAKKISPIIPLAAAGVGVALLLRGAKGGKPNKEVLSESERGEVLAGLPDSADIIYENGQVILGQNFIEDNFMAYVNNLPGLLSGPQTAANMYLNDATFIDADLVGEEQARPLSELKELDPEAYDELSTALRALSKAHYELRKAEEGTEAHEWSSWWHAHRSVSQDVKAAAREGSSISKVIIAQIERLKSTAE